MESVKNIKQVLIAADCDRTVGVQIWDPGSTTTYLGNGEVVITSPNGTVLDTTTATAANADRIFIQQRGSTTGAVDTVYRSVEIPGAMITGYYCENYTASSEQTSVLGYNGVSGAADINLVADTLYYIKVIPLFTAGQRDPETFAWKSGNTVPTEADVLLGISAAINNKAGYDSTLKITSAVATDATPVAIVPTATVSNGSKYVTFSGAVTTLVEGDVLTIATIPYKVDEVLSTTKVKLTSPYQGVSATAVALAEVPKTDNWGLSITGLPYEFEAGFFNYNIAKFNLTVSEDINSKFVTTAGDRGAGTYKQVADMEWHTKNFFGNNKKTHPQYPIDYKYDANSADTYDLITITWENTETKNIDGNTIQSGSVVIAVPVGAGQADGGTTTIEEVLNKYIVTEFGVGTAIALS